MRVLIRFIANSIKAASSPAIFPVFQFLMSFHCLGIGCASFGHSWWVELWLCFDHRMSVFLSKKNPSWKSVLQENWLRKNNKKSDHLTSAQEATSFAGFNENSGFWAKACRLRGLALDSWILEQLYDIHVGGQPFRRNLFMVFRGFSGGLLWKV